MGIVSGKSDPEMLHVVWQGVLDAANAVKVTDDEIGEGGEPCDGDGELEDFVVDGGAEASGEGVTEDQSCRRDNDVEEAPTEEEIEDGADGV